MVRATKLILATLLVVLAGTSPALAYIDPNSGGLIFQILTPIIALVGASVAFAGRQITQAFRFIVGAIKNLAGRIAGTSGSDSDLDLD